MITFSSSLNESIILDCFSSDEAAILLLLLLDGTGDMLELLILSMEFLDRSEIGDLVDDGTLTERGMHFEFPGDDDSFMSGDFKSLHVLHIYVQDLLQMKHWP